MAEQRLIDTDELKKKFRIECAGECAVCKNNNNFESCELIDSAPIVDAVRVVRCRDCKHWHDDGIMTTCDKHFGHGFQETWFCADGERKDGNSDATN